MQETDKTIAGFCKELGNRKSVLIQIQVNVSNATKCTSFDDFLNLIRRFKRKIRENYSER